MVSEELNSVFSDAISFAKENHHEYITIEHIFFALLHNNQIEEILFKCGADCDFLKKNLMAYFLNHVEKIVTNDDYNPFETVSLTRVIESMMIHVKGAGKSQATLTDMLVAMFDEEHSYSVAILKSQGVEKLDVLEVITELSPTKEEKQKDKKSALELYTINLVELATKGKIDPLIGRVDEVNRLMQVLCRRKKNNPILVGEAGVGKTAIVEGLALKIAKNETPTFFRSG